MAMQLLDAPYMFASGGRAALPPHKEYLYNAFNKDFITGAALPLQ